MPFQRRNRHPNVPIPVTKDEIIEEVTIVSTGKGGDGIAKVSGFIVFVPDTKPGDKVKIQITEVMSRYAKAVVIK